MPSFEIGCVYVRSSKYFIAQSKTDLVRITDGVLVRCKPRVQYDKCRKISVEELCVTWKVTLQEFDRLLGQLFTPKVIRTKPRKGRRKQDADVEEYRQLRMVRLAQ